MKKVAVVTGGSKGLGLAIVKELAGVCDLVIATYSNTQPSFTHSNVIYKKLDITSSSECLDLISELAASSIHPNILINNAGITADSMFHRMSFDKWLDVINVNLVSMYNLTHPLFTSMREMGFGRIINISSVNAGKGQLGQANYCASKAGIQGFTKVLALEGAAKGITANTVSPGYCETDMISSISPDILETIRKTIPQKRFGEPQEIGSLVKFLVSDEAAYINGANLDINGGLYCS